MHRGPACVDINSGLMKLVIRLRIGCFGWSLIPRSLLLESTAGVSAHRGERETANTIAAHKARVSGVRARPHLRIRRALFQDGRQKVAVGANPLFQNSGTYVDRCNVSHPFAFMGPRGTQPSTPTMAAMPSFCNCAGDFLCESALTCEGFRVSAIT